MAPAPSEKLDIEQIADGATIERFRPSPTNKVKNAWAEDVLPENSKSPPKERFGFGPTIQMEFSPLCHGKLTGQADRNAITGEICVRRADAFSNFTVVDLLNRKILTSNYDHLVTDVFLFKPIPMKYRTWVYHCMHTGQTRVNRKTNPFAGTTASFETEMIEEVLTKPCLDDNHISGGRWSPMAVDSFMAMALALTGRLDIVGLALIHNVLLMSISVMLNTPKAYFTVRLLTLPIRVAFILFFFVVLPMNSMVSVIGSVLALLIMLFDFLMGDVNAFLTIRYWCTYKIVNALNSSVYVCERSGADSLGEPGKDDVSVDFAICQIIPWRRHHAIIADMQGLLVELVPMSRNDWAIVLNDYQHTQTSCQFTSIDIGYALVEDEDLEPVTSENANSKIWRTRPQASRQDIQNTATLTDYEVWAWKAPKQLKVELGQTIAANQQRPGATAAVRPDKGKPSPKAVATQR